MSFSYMLSLFKKKKKQTLALIREAIGFSFFNLP